jgi:hypothetical protein
MRFTNDWLRRRIEVEPDGMCVEVGAAFWCECGTPFSQDPETERKERAAGKCLLCIGADEP